MDEVAESEELVSEMPLEARRSHLREQYRRVRAATLEWVAPLSDEDCIAQSMTEASPVRWQLAHTSWFFETFVLAAADPEYAPVHPRYGFLFNSYYDSVGERVARDVRGLQTRPSVDEVRAYRFEIDARVDAWFDSSDALGPRLDVLELGLNHEQQHLELIVTDFKHLLSLNPLEPAYAAGSAVHEDAAAPALEFVRFEEGLRVVGHRAAGFAFDNEGPAHKVYLQPFELASRPVTCREYLEFIAAGGYREPRWWLSDGWAWLNQERIEAPLYWRREGSDWSSFTLHGRVPLELEAPACHVSFYEADAYARFRGARLPREAEWEVAAADEPLQGNFLESGANRPRPTRAQAGRGLHALFGDVWEWTQSPYAPYPGYRAAEGALGEYNGKFMCNQMVLRGGSCATPASHVRASYRNFFHPVARWQFSGLRLARDV